MSIKIGHFEILSELSKSATGVVYKANDPQTNQTVALKAITLAVFGEQATALEASLLSEAGATKTLSHSNLTSVYGAGVIDGQFCAAMEYIQGNSIATMLARKEGFSIWDMLDIGRQVCGGIDYGQSQNVFHYGLEPGKIMCGWDGTVRILGYGVSSVGKFTGQMPGLPLILHYMSPEQIRGESIDARSNLFSLGAMLYEMVTEQKPFDGADSESVRLSIVESAPAAPIQLNPKVHPALNELILKAVAKDPAQRYQNGREFLDDLEKCKESKPQAAKAAPAKSSVVIPDAVKAANQAKFIAGAAAANAKAAGAASSSAAVGSIQASPAAPTVSAPRSQPAKPPSAAPAKPVVKPVAQPPASMSSAAVDEPVAAAPKIVVDPMMAGDAPVRGGGISFSEMTELPPLKEDYTPVHDPAPLQPHSPAPPVASSVTMYRDEPEKPKVQPREVAEKAIKEIKNVPPRLMVYSIAGAAVVILIIAVALVMHVNTLNSDGDTPRPAAVEQASQPARPTPQPQPVPLPPAPSIAMEAQPAPSVVEEQPAPTHAVAAVGRGRNAKRKTAAQMPTVIASGQMVVDSTPTGAQVQLDGKTDASWITPFILSGVTVGQHSVTVSKAGYSSDSRTVEIVSGNKLSVVSHLALLTATLAVSSTPTGANIYVDGKDSGKLTPAQVSVDKGQHVILVRKSGFIDETTNAQFNLGQTTNFSPTLRSLGNVDDIKTVGKMKKMFGGKEAQGMGQVSIKTQPKGAQVAVNQHMLDKGSPVEFMLDPGNYIVDITLTGYAPIHKVINVDKGGKAVIDEVLQHD